MHKLFLTLFPLSIFLSLSGPVHALDGTWQLIKFRRWAMNHFNSVSFPDPGNGWIGGTKLYRTRDSGLTWEDIMGAPSDPEVRDVVFIDKTRAGSPPEQTGCWLQMTAARYGSLFPRRCRKGMSILCFS